MSGTAEGEAAPDSSGSFSVSDRCGSNPLPTGSLGTATGPPDGGTGGAGGVNGAAGAGGVNGAPGAGTGGVKGAPGAG
ncbi:hypothetical protein, partial [Streptomyces sp. 13-12-16]|uniref:hypothetical protein n=1 Tax=Streptomyces sp. 13-12-16 TaxID=1570823 RepID=UPI00358FD9C5